MIVPSANSSSNCKKKGFALVLALALLSLVFLLVISLVNLVSTDLSLVEARKEKILAQAHARMGMKIAMGEIQKHLGPDMRISATADLLDERIESGKNYEKSPFSGSQSTNRGVDLNEDGSIDPLPYGQRHWTGVWKHRGRDRGVDDSKLGARPLPENFETGDNVPDPKNAYPTKNSEFDPHPAIEVAWLVSGNEGFNKQLYFGNNPYQVLEFVEIPDGNLWDTEQADNGRSFISLGGGSGIYGNYENAWEDYTMALLNSPLKGTAPLPEYNHPIFELPDPQVSDDVEWLLVSPLLKKDYDKNNFDLEDSTTWENDLSSEPVKARKTRVQHEVEGNEESQYGAYAYWVGDEGVKTKVSVQNPFKPDFDPKPTDKRNTSQIQKDNLAVATEPNLTFSVNSGSLLSGFGIDWEEATTENKKKDILSLGTLSELSDTKSEISAHYHSLTTDSFGVLSDVRTGGLKRDLSSAFANEEDWMDKDFLEFDDRDWSDDFSNYIYKQRIYYMKSVPMKEDAFENEWLTSSSNQPLLEEMTLLGGPRWSLLGSFHNLYLASKYGDIIPDNFPRIVGDNNILFNHLQGYGLKPKSPGNVEEVRNIDKLIQRYNYFEGIGKRPEPKIHPIQPVLVEFKYSQQPILYQGSLGLAAYPSVAFWNPYNVPISSSKIYIEVPMNSSMRFGDPKVYDLYKKWLIHISDIEEYNEKFPNINPDQATQGGPTFDDVNGNGKQDPGERTFFSPNNSGKDPPFYPRSRHWFSGGWDINCNFKRNTCTLSSNFGTFNSESGQTKYPRRQFDGRFLKSSDSDDNDYLQSLQNRHLLIEISGLSLQPGEKLHFVPSNEKNVFTHTNLQSKDEGTVFLKISMKALSGGNEKNPVYFLSGKSEFSATDPVMIWYECGNVKGVHPNANEDFDRDMTKGKPSNLEYPKGITIYSEDPEKNAFPKIIGKINKDFDFRVGGTANGAHRLDIAQAGYLDNITSSKLFGHGFRIRYKLPGKTDKITFEQFNLRALIHSNQDGYGDNWEFESTPGKYSDDNFNRVDFFTAPDPTIYPDKAAMDLVVTDINAFTPNSPTLVGMNLMPAIPKLQYAENSIGFFHENQGLGGMEGVKSAIMFEIPDSPMLSIFQFRHANLNNYSHGPSYALGNSYASTQVARYRTWGKVRAISEAPMYPGTDIKYNNKVQNLIYQDPTLDDRDYFNWKNKLVSNAEGVPIRDLYAGKDHQNVTQDHSFYINYALMDGYFMSGLGFEDSQWEQADPNDPELFDPGVRFLPFRNPRLIPYLREAEWKSTSYSDGKKEVDENDEEFRYQTLSSDLLVDGAFNVNSTSVDAWASQLSSLRGQAIEGDGVTVQDDETPIPRFLEYKLNDSWNMLRKLSDEDVNLLAHKIVRQVKLRGPFLSFADFVNRRLQGNVVNLYLFPFDEWEESDKKETRSSTLGLRGAVQAAIAEAGLNQGEFKENNSDSSLPIPEVPERRFDGDKVLLDPIEDLWPLAENLNLIPSEFGIHAVSKNLVSYQIGTKQEENYLSYPLHEYSDQSTTQYEQAWGRGMWIDGVRDLLTEWYPPTHKNYGDAKPKKVSGINWGGFSTGDTLEMNIKFLKYEDLFSYGEAPENLLAVENIATGANKPGWVMQSDLLSPLAPVTSVRSDTFVIRVMGETLQKENAQTQSKAWIELTVQRVPDYVKSDKDNPHHRPHEPFEDRNFNGYWDAQLTEPEHWIDYDQDSIAPNGQGEVTQKNILDKKGSYPDLASDNDTFADGLKSDLPINQDEDEEVVSNSGAMVSLKGINQRFGRKFKIIKFRWLKAQDV